MDRPGVSLVDYDDDLVPWTAHQARLLRGRDCERLDVQDLIEKFDDMLSRKERASCSRLHQLINHVLKASIRRSASRQAGRQCWTSSAPPSSAGSSAAPAMKTRQRCWRASSAPGASVVQRARPVCRRVRFRRSCLTLRNNFSTRVSCHKPRQAHGRLMASLIVAPFHVIIAGFPFPHSS
ncbi:DUF29 family protein [Massilia atriviolacea]|uniref:DUF29 family protein n=1 Tax=Massilia atriviolacea TaxID=2495579 RepID=A0A430HN17_9BURK|nr:DUF29 family protein [Massilia atriviolacea]